MHHQTNKFMTTYEIEEKIVAMLKTVYDPEIPVNVYDLGLIYKIDVADSGDVTIDMDGENAAFEKKEIAQVRLHVEF